MYDYQALPYEADEMAMNERPGTFSLADKATFISVVTLSHNSIGAFHKMRNTPFMT
jgi:hypothetical protein